MASKRLIQLSVLIVALAAGGVIVWSALAKTSTPKDDLQLISRATGATGAGATADSSHASTSADGRYVAFVSGADNLSDVDDDAFTNIFVRDTDAGTTTLVSRTTGATGAGANADTSEPAISADGRYVVFGSQADNLSPDDNNAYGNVFVRDTQANTTKLVSRATGTSGVGADGTAFEPAISPDGRYVVFASDASNLTPDDTSGNVKILMRDIQGDSTTLISRASGASGASANDSSYHPTVSSDGHQVAFESFGRNLSTDDIDGYKGVFVRDTQANTTTLASRATGSPGASGDDSSDYPSISSAGRYVTFRSGADNLSADADPNHDNIFLRDTEANTVTLISRMSGIAGSSADGESRLSSISADGRYVAFESDADNLSADDDNSLQNIFLRDKQSGTTALVSRMPGATGAGADGASAWPSISDDGRYVGFDSLADNLSPDDENAARNVFLRDVVGPVQDAPPPAEPQAAPATPPALCGLTVKQSKSARVSTRIGTKITATTSACTLSITREIRIKGKKRAIKLKSSKLTLTQGRAVTVRFTIPRFARRQAISALKQGKTATLRVKIVGRSSAGSQTKIVSTRLKR